MPGSFNSSLDEGGRDMDRTAIRDASLNNGPTQGFYDAFGGMEYRETDIHNGSSALPNETANYDRDSHNTPFRNTLLSEHTSITESVEEPSRITALPATHLTQPTLVGTVEPSGIPPPATELPSISEIDWSTHHSGPALSCYMPMTSLDTATNVLDVPGVHWSALSPWPAPGDTNQSTLHSWANLTAPMHGTNPDSAEPAQNLPNWYHDASLPGNLALTVNNDIAQSICSWHGSQCLPVDRGNTGVSLANLGTHDARIHVIDLVGGAPQNQREMRDASAVDGTTGVTTSQESELEYSSLGAGSVGFILENPDTSALDTDTANENLDTPVLGIDAVGGDAGQNLPEWDLDWTMSENLDLNSTELFGEFVLPELMHHNSETSGRKMGVIVNLERVGDDADGEFDMSDFVNLEGM